MQGSVESLDLPVLPWTVRLDRLVCRFESFQRVSDRVGLGVAPMIVGHDPFDVADAVSREELGRAGDETCAGVTFFVGMNLLVCEPGVVIDHRVDVVEPDLRL